MANSFSETIWELRVKRDISLTQAAELVGCTKSHLWEMEKGRSRNPSIQILAGLAAAYRCDVGCLATLAAANAPGHERRLAVFDLVQAQDRVAATTCNNS